MKKSKAAPLTASLLARKGEARPAKTQVTIYDLTKPNMQDGSAKVESDQLPFEDTMPPAGGQTVQAETTEPNPEPVPADEPSMAQVLSASMPETAPVLPEPETKLKSYGPIKIVGSDEAGNDDAAAGVEAEPAPETPPESNDDSVEAADAETETPAPEAEVEDDPTAAEPMELTAAQTVVGDSAVASAKTEDRPTAAENDLDPYRLAPPYMPRSSADEKARAERERRRYALMGGAALAAAGIVVTMWFAYNVGMDQADEAGQRVIEAAAIRAERFPPVPAETSSAADDTPGSTAEVTVPETTVATATKAAEPSDEKVVAAAANDDIETVPVVPSLPEAIESAVNTASQKVSEPAATDESAPQPAAVQVADADADTSAGVQSVTVKVPLPPAQSAPTEAAETARAAVDAPTKPTDTKAAKPDSTAPIADETKAAEEKVAAVLPNVPVAPVKPESTAPTPPVPTKSVAAAKAEPVKSAAETTRTASLSPAAPPAGDFAIQISSVRTEAAAKVEWARLQRAHGDLLKSLPVNYQKAVIKDKGTYYRVQVGEMAKDAARKLCAQLKQRKQGCFVVKR